MAKTSGKEQFEAQLDVVPVREGYKGSGKLANKVAVITGGDSGIGRSVAVHFAREGADVVIIFEESTGDAEQTKLYVEAEGRTCTAIQGNVSNEGTCREIVAEVVRLHGHIDILVNNAGTHTEQERITDISRSQMEHTFAVNVFHMFYMTRFAMPVMGAGGAIINTASVTAYRGSDHLMDYASSKGAIISFTRSLAQNLASKQIRVNAVAPGPVWTPLIVESFDTGHLQEFGKNVPMGRAAYPYEVAPAYVYLACDDSSYVTGQVIHVNGGEIVNG